MPKTPPPGVTVPQHHHRVLKPVFPVVTKTGYFRWLPKTGYFRWLPKTGYFRWFFTNPGILVFFLPNPGILVFTKSGYLGVFTKSGYFGVFLPNPVLRCFLPKPVFRVIDQNRYFGLLTKPGIVVLGYVQWYRLCTVYRAVYSGGVRVSRPRLYTDMLIYKHPFVTKIRIFDILDRARVSTSQCTGQ